METPVKRSVDSLVSPNEKLAKIAPGSFPPPYPRTGLEPSRALDEASRAAASCLSLWGSLSAASALHALYPGWRWSSPAPGLGASSACLWLQPTLAPDLWVLTVLGPDSGTRFPHPAGAPYESGLSREVWAGAGCHIPGGWLSPATYSPSSFSRLTS